MFTEPSICGSNSMYSVYLMFSLRRYCCSRAFHLSTSFFNVCLKEAARNMSSAHNKLHGSTFWLSFMIASQMCWIAAERELSLNELRRWLETRLADRWYNEHGFLLFDRSCWSSRRLCAHRIHKMTSCGTLSKAFSWSIKAAYKDLFFSCALQLGGGLQVLHQRSMIFS